MSEQSAVRDSELTSGKPLTRRTTVIALSALLILLSVALIGIWLALASGPGDSLAAAKWVLKADYVDACCCDLACPCIFGEAPTHGFCKGTSLVEIKEGRYGQVDLGGVTVLAVYNSGEWIKFLVSENASQEQTDAIVELLPVAEGFFEAPVRDVRNVAISVKRTHDRVKIETEGTVVELEQVKSMSGGPIKVLGLPAEGFPGLPYIDHTQYKTITLAHDSENEKFEFSGTNGYTARLDASEGWEASESEPNGSSPIPE